MVQLERTLTLERLWTDLPLQPPSLGTNRCKAKGFLNSVLASVMAIMASPSV